MCDDSESKITGQGLRNLASSLRSGRWMRRPMTMYTSNQSESEIKVSLSSVLVSASKGTIPTRVGRNSIQEASSPYTAPKVLNAIEVTPAPVEKARPVSMFPSQSRVISPLVRDPPHTLNSRNRSQLPRGSGASSLRWDHNYLRERPVDGQDTVWDKMHALLKADPRVSPILDSAPTSSIETSESILTDVSPQVDSATETKEGSPNKSDTVQELINSPAYAIPIVTPTPTSATPFHSSSTTSTTDSTNGPTVAPPVENIVPPASTGVTLHHVSIPDDSLGTTLPSAADEGSPQPSLRQKGSVTPTIPLTSSSASQKAALAELIAFQQSMRQEVGSIGDRTSTYSGETFTSPRAAELSLYSGTSDKTETDPSWDTHKLSPFGSELQSDIKTGLGKIQTWSESIPAEVRKTIDKETEGWQNEMFHIIAVDSNVFQKLQQLDELVVEPLKLRWNNVCEFYASTSGHLRDTGDHHFFLLPSQERFMNTLFRNYKTLYYSYDALVTRLQERQSNELFVSGICDIYLEWFQDPEPFIEFLSSAKTAEALFTLEKSRNPFFSTFVDGVRMFTKGREDVNGLMMAVVQRLQNVHLAFESLSASLPFNAKDRPLIQQLVKKFRAATFAGNERMELDIIRSEFVDLYYRLYITKRQRAYLDLEAPKRQLIKREKMGQKSRQTFWIYLMDHLLLICRRVKLERAGQGSAYVIHGRPILLPMLLCIMDEPIGSAGIESPTVLPQRAGTVSPSPPVSPMVRARTSVGYDESQKDYFDTHRTKYVYPITFQHIGHHKKSIQLFVDSVASQKGWEHCIRHQQLRVISGQSLQLKLEPFCDRFFATENPVNCATPFTHNDGSQTILLGTADGLYAGSMQTTAGFMKLGNLKHITHMHIIPSYNQILLVANRRLHVILAEEFERWRLRPKLCIESTDLQVSALFARNSGGGITSPMIALVRIANRSSEFRIAQPICVESYKKKIPGLMWAHRKQRGKSLVGLVELKQGSLPTEVNRVTFFADKLGLVCTDRCEIVHLHNLRRMLMAPSSDMPGFDEVNDRGKAIDMFIVQRELLLCFQKVAFFITPTGQRSRPGTVIYWEGTPRRVLYRYPYLYAFCDKFIEIRHVETGELELFRTAVDVRFLGLVQDGLRHFGVDSNNSGVTSECVLGVRKSPNYPLYQDIFKFPFAKDIS
ncbi:RHO1 GDP-GTP exchange protein 2 [Dispira simplex]|nr:RHO1 GDP-GTP exchange protein 2 [Dispira simplex]